jgi:hypothetical protein
MACSENPGAPSANLPPAAKGNLELLSNYKDREEAQI